MDSKTRFSLLLVLSLMCSVTNASEDKLAAEFLLSTTVGLSDTTRSWLNGGLGKFRFDEDDDKKLLFDHLAVGIRYKPSLHSSLTIDLFHHNDPEGRLALTQAFWQYKPFRTKHWRSRYRFGIFHAPLSLENRGKFWTSPYTATPSILNSWLGEELRTVGAEGIWTWSKTPHAADKVSFIGALFGFNDPAGSMLSWRGWSGHNRQTGITERLPLRWLPVFAEGEIFEDQASSFEPFKEVDGRIGGYAGLEWRRGRTIKLQSVYYHNNGSPLAIKNGQYSWRTQFAQVALHLRLPRQWELLTQVMSGNTLMGQRAVNNDFYAVYMMFAKTLNDRHRIALRVEQYGVDDKDNLGNLDRNDESGWATTFSYNFMPSARWRLSMEYNSNDWSRQSNTAVFEQRIRWQEKQLSLSARYFFEL
ncbi:MAG: hypothetical protein AB8B86_00100 [Pseudomonadales bacterium]